MKTKALILCSLFAALTAVGAFIKVPFLYSSITLQFFFTALAGVLLGAKYGALSQLVYVALGLAGLPIFTSGGGLGYFLYPTCGFLLGLIPAAWVIGTLAGDGRSMKRVVPAALAGLAVLYAVGLPYMAFILNVYMGKGMNIGAVLMAGMIPFLPGDMVKIIVVGILAPKLLPRLRLRPADAKSPS
ncbi:MULTISPECIES: biotin transporter BioY [unclassified Oscillibacter]|uniref:biotin transporter BioY n=1 Tax=unclassified Oscillibacter TaxID=2629304 RepID=UPI0025E4583B|nr:MULTISPECIES: biotin transporter BioY [unclassified Oscillibacter]